MTLAVNRDQFLQDGYTIIRQFLPPEEFARLRSELDRYITDVVPTLDSALAFYEDRDRGETLKQLSGMDQDPFFAEYKQHDRWLQVARELLGEDGIVQGVEWFNKPPNTDHRTPPHQDNYYFCLSPPNVLTMWLALDSIDEENGCLRYVCGSHLEPLRPHQRTTTLGFSQGITDFSEGDSAREVAVTAEPNDLLIHHGQTIHRADANRSTTRHRRSFAMVVRGTSCTRDNSAYQRYLNGLNEQHQELNP